MAARGHGDPAGLEGKPFPPPDCHCAVIERVTEYRARKRNLALG